MRKRTSSSGVWISLALLTAWQLSSGIAAAQSALPAPWQQTDVGDVGLAGSGSENRYGDLIITGAGSDIWGTADSFHFVYQTIYEGNISASDAEQENTNPFAKIGIMIRQNLDPGSPQVILDLKPDGSVEFMTRATAGGTTTFIAGVSSTHAGITLRLSRFSGQIEGAICDFEHGCTRLGSVPFPDGPALAGAVITSHDPSVLNHGAFGEMPIVNSVPPPWRSLDFGTVGLGGSANFQQGAFTVRGAGADIWGTNDAFHYVFQQLSGDGVIVARVTSEDAANTFAKAGVLADMNAGAGSPVVVLDIRPNGVIEFMARPTYGPMSFIAGSAASFPVWLKLQRSGNTYTGYMSTDGTGWQFVGSTTVSSPTDIFAGLAVTSHDTSALNTSTFDHVSLSSAAALDIDVGDVGAVGRYIDQSQTKPGLFAIQGAGADIWGTSDAFNFFYRHLSQDGGVQYRVLGFTDQNTNTFAKAGVTIRETIDPASAHVILDVRPNGQIELMTRSTTGAQTTFVAGATATFPVDLNLTRSGSTITATMSTDGGSTWSTVGNVSVSFESDVLAGAVVTSHQRGVLTNALFEH